MCQSYINIFNFFSSKVLQLIKNITFAPGELAEWSNAVVLKTIDPSRDPRVRIPYSPQKTHGICHGFFYLLRFTNILVLL